MLNWVKNQKGKMYFKFLILSLLVLLISSCEEKVNDAWISVNLPESPPEKENKEEKAIDLFVYKNRYEYQKKEHSLEEIGLELKKFDKEIALNIKISKKAGHDKLVKLLDLANKLDIIKFNLHTCANNRLRCQ